MKLSTVIFDWAGTVVDHGSRAPVAALQDVFVGAGVPVTVAEAPFDGNRQARPYPLHSPITARGSGMATESGSRS